MSIHITLTVLTCLKAINGLPESVWVYHSFSVRGVQEIITKTEIKYLPLSVAIAIRIRLVTNKIKYSDIVDKLGTRVS